VVPGPGFLNASAALISAYGASAAVICLTGEIPSAFVGRGLGHLHELPDQLATMRSLTKWAATVEARVGLPVGSYQEVPGNRRVTCVVL
jgi:acetolactate synthase-1/2/3 large subunit